MGIGFCRITDVLFSKVLFSPPSPRGNSMFNKREEKKRRFVQGLESSGRVIRRIGQNRIVGIHLGMSGTNGNGEGSGYC